jgi:hypothetical protein
VHQRPGSHLAQPQRYEVQRLLELGTAQQREQALGALWQLDDLLRQFDGDG